MIEEVKRILAEVRDTALVLEKFDVSLYPKPVSFVQQICQLLEPKPDKGRLLTDEEICFHHRVFEDEAHEHWHYTPKEIAKAQRNLTASIVDKQARQKFAKKILRFLRWIHQRAFVDSETGGEGIYFSVKDDDYFDKVIQKLEEDADIDELELLKEDTKQARQEMVEEIMGEFDCLKLAPNDDAYFRILVNDALEYIRTGKRAAERQRLKRKAK